MTNKLALAASLMMLMTISGQAFARTTGSNTQYRPEVANSLDQQVVPAYGAFDDPWMATQIAEPYAHRYHGGPKYND